MQEVLPPTVPVALTELLRDEQLALHQVAGPPAGPGDQVYAVHTSEMGDPVPYLLGGELLLTAGVHGPAPEDGAERHWAQYVTRTVRAGATALGFGIAPLYDEVPPALAGACDRHGLPLLRVPEETPFTAVARTLWQLVAERRHRDLQRLSAAQQALTTAATRPHPVPAVLARLAEQTDGWAALFGRGGREVAVAGAEPPPDERCALAALTGRLRAAPSSAADASGAWRLSAFALTGAAGGADDGERLALGVCAPGPEGADDALVRSAVALLSLLTSHRVAATNARPSAALVRLLLGFPVADVLPALGVAGLWTVVHGRRRPGTPDHGLPARAGLAAGLRTDLVDVDGDTLRALVPGDGPVAAQPGWTLGASRPVAADDLPLGDAGAAESLGRAVAEHRPVVRQRRTHSHDLGALLAPGEARARARARLRPLADRPALVETLRAWLSVHGSWDRSAAALGVHRNTVRQRIARTGQLLDADLGDPDERAELWLALRWV
ncbi:PucR family transcriptional regulator [Streptomyces sp. DSM 42041]|uniref:PucR family transcriptional regulator n=1 Tax=Streptomyces hazeniae TaxID=3075538 RepID=A0ABU2NKW4_9ACTN|nr:PucR family transcriptional regulator [Streptomyces sp. DSM 42041]MDT0377640.1 PucR family transcriptional regulator [Streptomyces sp. DSM 42041]